MRHNQNSNKRLRNRGKRHSNPVNRVYESNGPDIKVKGTAMHIAEKYTSLSRDALAVGDIIANENYAQHAEHYNRLAAAATMYNQQQNSLQKTSADGEDSTASGDSTNEDGVGVNGAEDSAKHAQPNGSGRKRHSRKSGASSAAKNKDSAEVEKKEKEKESDSLKDMSSSREGDSLAHILPTSKTE